MPVKQAEQHATKFATKKTLIQELVKKLAKQFLAKLVESIKLERPTCSTNLPTLARTSPLAESTELAKPEESQ